MHVKPPGLPELPRIAPPPELSKLAPVRSAPGQLAPSPPLPIADSVSVLARIRPQDTALLLQILEPPLDVHTTGQASALVATLVQHVQSGATDQVDGLVRQIAQRDPAVAERLPDHAELLAARPEIESTIRHLSVAAKADAEQAVTAAGVRLQEISRPTGAWHSEPKALLDICETLIAAGGLVNYRKAENLAFSIRPDGTLFVDVSGQIPVIDARGWPRRLPKELGFLPQGPLLSGVLLLLALLIIAAAYLLR